MEEDLSITDDLLIPGSELWFTASRAGGPGGQHVNTTSSRVTLHWSLVETSVLTPVEINRVHRRLNKRINSEGLIQVSCDDTRSQQQNRILARQRLAELIREALIVFPKRIPTRPSRGAKQKRLKQKKHRGQIKNLRRPPSSED